MKPPIVKIPDSPDLCIHAMSAEFKTVGGFRRRPRVFPPPGSVVRTDRLLGITGGSNVDDVVPSVVRPISIGAL